MWNVYILAVQIWQFRSSQQYWEKAVQMAVIGSSEVASNVAVAVANVAVHIEISRLSLMSFVYMSKCHPIALFLLLHQT